MTREEVSDLLEVVDKLWPHSNIVGGNLDLTIKVWHMVMKEAPADAVQEALMAEVAKGEKFAPPPGVLYAQALRVRAGEPPSFEDMQAFLARHTRCLPYGPFNTPEDTVKAIGALSEAGAHEAILRFVASQGVYAIRMMPDPTLQPLDVGQQADRRDKAREYRQRTLEDWRADPTPGVALVRAQSALGQPSRRRLESGGSEEAS